MMELAMMNIPKKSQATLRASRREGFIILFALWHIIFSQNTGPALKNASEKYSRVDARGVEGGGCMCDSGCWDDLHRAR
jgi:hypothetical protein